MRIVEGTARSCGIKVAGSRAERGSPLGRSHHGGTTMRKRSKRYEKAAKLVDPRQALRARRGGRRPPARCRRPSSTRPSARACASASTRRRPTSSCAARLAAARASARPCTSSSSPRATRRGGARGRRRRRRGRGPRGEDPRAAGPTSTSPSPTPTMMHVGKLGKVLGPQGKMPTPKSGTVDRADVGAGGQGVQGRQGRVPRPTPAATCTRRSASARFAAKDLEANIDAFLDHIRALRPASAKGDFIRKVSLSTTMGPGISLQVA